MNVYLLAVFGKFCTRPSHFHDYNVGTQPFGPLTLLTRPPTLIPRPETEEWTIRLAAFLSKHLGPISSSHPIRLLDLCTGSGCIPLLLCKLLPNGSIHSVGVDVSESALGLARENAVICGNWDSGGDDSNGSRPEEELDESDSETPTHERNTFMTLLADIRKRTELSTLLRSLAYPPSSSLSAPNSAPSKLFKPFTVLTANPPYITPSAYERLDPSVRDYEDRGALVGTDDPRARTPGLGLGFYYDIATFVRECGVLAGDEVSIPGDVVSGDNGVSRNGGAVVAMEVGEGQAGDVVDIVKEGMPGFGENVEVWKDAFGVDRVVVAMRDC